MKTWGQARGYLLLTMLGVVVFLLVSSMAKSLLTNESTAVSPPAVSDTLKAEVPKAIPESHPDQGRVPEGVM